MQSQYSQQFEGIEAKKLSLFSVMFWQPLIFDLVVDDAGTLAIRFSHPVPFEILSTSRTWLHYK
jgi:hypothetical protein